jgi:hypothetical protein
MQKRLWPVLLTVFAACAANDAFENENEPDSIDLTLPAQTPAQLVAFEFPPGFRPGDKLRLADRADASRQRRFAWVAPIRAPETAPSSVYRIEAHGRDGRIGLLQVSLLDARQQPLEAFSQAAGLRVTGQVGAIKLPYCRDRMTMSSDHLHSEAYQDKGRLLTTDREGLFLAVRSNGNVDGFLWVGDESLLGIVDAVSYRRVLEAAERALAGTDVPAMIAAKSALQQSGIEREAGEPSAQAAALIARVDAKVREHDAPLVAEIERITAPVARQVSSEDFATAVATVGRCAQQLAPVVRRLLGGYPPSLHEPFRQLQYRAGELADGGENSAVVPVAFHVSQAMSMWHDDIAKYLTTAQAFDAATTYAAARQRHAELKSMVGKACEQRDLVWRHGVAAACDREAATFAGQGNPEAARYLRDLGARVRGGGGDYAPEKYEHERQVDGFCRKLSEYCKLGDDTARLEWLLRESGPDRIFRRSNLRQQDEFEYRSHVHLTDLLQEFVDREGAAAEAARAQGLPATAALHGLRSVALFGRASHRWETPFGVASSGHGVATQEGTAARAVQDLMPLLRVVLPPIAASTDESDRLVQLFREGECLDWPLVRYLTFQFEAGDPQLTAWRGDAPLRFAWLESRGTDELVLSARGEPQTQAGLGFLARLSGLSAETIAESQALRAENAAIDELRRGIDGERSSRDAEAARVKELGQQIDRDRPSLDNGNEAAVRAFNERVAAFNVELQAAKASEQAFNARVQELNARVAAYNPRVSVNNERQMRERAAGGHRVDTMLRRALAQWLDVAFGDYEAQLRQRGVDEAALARELELAKWWFGRARPWMPAWLEIQPKALADMHRLALERTVHVQPTNEALAKAVVSHWYWSRQCFKLREQEAFFREWAKTFRWQRDVKFLQDAIAADARLHDGDRRTMERLLREADQR